MNINPNKNNFKLILKISIDRFENKFAVCENKETGEILNIPICELPENVKEGSIIIFKNGKYILDIESTQSERKEIKELVNNLFKKK